jgi:hypothetical protein
LKIFFISIKPFTFGTVLLLNLLKKETIMKTRILILGMILSIMAISCSKNDAKEENTLTQEEISTSAKIDDVADDISKIVENQMEEGFGISNRGASSTEEFLPSCAVVTRNPETGFPAVGQNIEKVIDFGTTGCVFPLTGAVLKGMIKITIPYQPNSNVHTATYTFIDFYHNARKIQGTKTFVRTFTPATASAVAKLVVVMNMDLSITLADGRVITRTGSRTRELVEGLNTPLIFLDNIYKVTGEWFTTFPNASVKTSTITSPLFLKIACSTTNKSIFSKGVITFTRNNNTATLDYGDGNCDNIAVFTKNGVSTTITLGN